MCTLCDRISVIANDCLIFNLQRISYFLRLATVSNFLNIRVLIKGVFLLLNGNWHENFFGCCVFKCGFDVFVFLTFNRCMKLL